MSEHREGGWTTINSETRRERENGHISNKRGAGGVTEKQRDRNWKER